MELLARLVVEDARHALDDMSTGGEEPAVSLGLLDDELSTRSKALLSPRVALGAAVTILRLPRRACRRAVVAAQHSAFSPRANTTEDTAASRRPAPGSRLHCARFGAPANIPDVPHSPPGWVAYGAAFILPSRVLGARERASTTCRTLRLARRAGGGARGVAATVARTCLQPLEARGRRALHQQKRPRNASGWKHA